MTDNAGDILSAALRQQREMQSAIRRNANSIAGLLVGQLDAVDNDTLGRLKIELRKFNIHTGKWRK